MSCDSPTKDEAQAALESAQQIYSGLERDFFTELAVDHYVLCNEYDTRAASILSTLLDYAVRVEERKQGPYRRFSGGELFSARARKAAELLPKVRAYWQKENFTFDYCATRKILWEALADGVMNCGYEGFDFDPEVAQALLRRSELSDDERKTRESVLREKFNADAYHARRAMRFLHFGSEKWQQ